MKIIITKKDVIWNYLGYLVNISVNILLIPFIFIMLGEEEIGLWYVFLSIGGLMDVLDFGFSPVISRNVSYIWTGAKTLNIIGFTKSENNGDIDYFFLKKMLKTSSKIYSYLSLIVLIILLSIGTMYINTVAGKALPFDQFITAWIIFAVAVFLNMRFSFWVYVLKGVGAIEDANRTFIYSKLIQLVLTLLLLLSGFGIIGMATAYLVSTFVQRILALYYFNRYKNVGLKLKKYKNSTVDNEEIKVLFKTLIYNSYKQGIITLSFFSLNKSPVFISSFFLDLGTTGKIGFTLQIFSLVSAFGNSLFNSYLPQFTSEKFLDNIKNTYSKVITTFKTSLFILLGSGTLLIIFGNPLFSILQMNVTMLSRFETTIFLISFVLINFHFLSGTFIARSNNLYMYKAYIISAFIMIALQISLSLYTDLGIWAILLPMLFVQSAYNNWKWPKVVAQEFNVNFRTFIKDLFSYKPI